MYKSGAVETRGSWVVPDLPIVGIRLSGYTKVG